MKKKNDYANKKLKEIEELVKGSSCGILITDTGINTYCSGADMLSFISIMIHKAKKHLPKELIEKAVKLGFKDEEELEKKVKEVETLNKELDKMLRKVKDVLEK